MDTPKETRAAKPVETSTVTSAHVAEGTVAPKDIKSKTEESKDTSPVDMTPLEYSKRFNPIAAHLTKNATKED